MTPPPELRHQPHSDLYDFEGESGIWHGPLGPADPVNLDNARLIGGAIGLGLAIMAVALWSALPTLCRLAASLREVLL